MLILPLRTWTAAACPCRASASLADSSNNRSMACSPPSFENSASASGCGVMFRWVAETCRLFLLCVLMLDSAMGAFSYCNYRLGSGVLADSTEIIKHLNAEIRFVLFSSNLGAVARARLVTGWLGSSAVHYFRWLSFGRSRLYLTTNRSRISHCLGVGAWGRKPCGNPLSHEKSRNSFSSLFASCVARSASLVRACSNSVAMVVRQW